MNETMLPDVIWPILRRAVNFYTHFQIYNVTDGYVHLPTTFSPEFPERGLYFQPSSCPPLVLTIFLFLGPDTNYDLALYRWGLMTALEIAEKFSIDDPNIPVWEDTLTK